MATLGMRDSFARYGATLKNVQWSVSAWTPKDELVLSLWAHHSRKGPPETMEFAASASRWNGPGKNEFVENVGRAFREKRPVRLVIVSTPAPERVEAGEDGGTIPKTFDVRDDVIGEILEWDGQAYVIRFSRV
jgi:hypothetical protein